MPNCDLCGTPVEVVGRTTMHYEPVTWRPIETAPKDGTLVLLFGYANEGTRSLFLSRFKADYAGGPKYWQWGAPGFTGEVTASHWMPLPKPPKHKEGRGDGEL